MAVPTCAVKARIFNSAGGLPVKGAVIFATLSSYEVFYMGHLVPFQARAETDEDGEATLHLFPNELGSVESVYNIRIQPPNAKVLRTTAVVPNLAEVDLQAITVLPPYEGKNDGQILIDEAIAAAGEALGYRNDARQAATEAAASAVSASTDAATATTARDVTVAARDVVVAARDIVTAAVPVVQAAEQSASQNAIVAANAAATATSAKDTAVASAAQVSADKTTVAGYVTAAQASATSASADATTASNARAAAESAAADALASKNAAAVSATNAGTSATAAAAAQAAAEAVGSGWSPRLSMVADGLRQVMRVDDWVGGAGTKPPVGVYVGAAGFVVNIADATNLRGSDGAGAGNVNTSGSVVQNHVAVYADATGDLIRDGGALSAVALSGAYADLSGLPTIPAAQVQSDWLASSGMGMILNKPTVIAEGATQQDARNAIGAGTSSFSGDYNDLANRPTLFSGAYADLTGKPTLGTASAQDVDYFVAEGDPRLADAREPAGATAVGLSILRAADVDEVKDIIGSTGALDFVVIAANTTAVSGKEYLFNAPGVTLTLPASPVDGDEIGFCNVSGGDCVINFNGKTLRGADPVAPFTIRDTWAKSIRYSSAKGTWV